MVDRLIDWLIGRKIEIDTMRQRDQQAMRD